ncbi:MAG: hypothetical protein AAFY16_00595 [Cyanobacteria bacterium J06642_3]
MFTEVLKPLLLALYLVTNLSLSSCQILAPETVNTSEDTQMLSNTYIISPKREFRSSVNRDWQADLTKIKGLKIVGGNSRRIQVTATSESIETAKNKLGKGFYVEPSIEYQRSF